MTKTPPPSKIKKRKEKTYVERWGDYKFKRQVWWGKPKGGVVHGIDGDMEEGHGGLWAWARTYMHMVGTCIYGRNLGTTPWA